jgi:cold shock CspA family protein
MSKPTSFNKRDIEKKKRSKRLEKQQKKENRKAGAKDSFEDMIAYVDENGVITDTPSETVKTEVDVESIAVSTPKRKESDEDPVCSGLVEYFNRSKGFGFIKDLSNGEKYFFHISNAPEEILEGNKVFFDLERGTRGLNAVRIRFDK